MSESGFSSLWSRASSEVVLKIYTMVLRAETLLSERGEIGEAGYGDRSAVIKSRAAAMAKLVGEGIGGKPHYSVGDAFSMCL